MRDSYPLIFRLVLFLCCLAFLSEGVDAQLILEREFVGGAAIVTTVSDPGSGQELLVDATFGQPIIGFAEGDLIVTIGFHQTDTNVDGLQAGDDLPEVARLIPTETIDVAAYPNPVVERLIVDMGEHKEEFEEIFLIDLEGRPVKTQRTNNRQLITFDQLDDLTTAYYYLQGVDRNGKRHQLATVMIITH